MGGAIPSSFPRQGWESSRNFWTKWSELRRSFPRKASSPEKSPVTHLPVPSLVAAETFAGLAQCERSIEFPRHARRFACADPRGVAPKPLQIVMLADIGPHHVHDDVEKIQHHPGGLQRAIHCAGPKSVFFPQFMGGFIGDGARARLARAGANDKIVRHRRQLAQLEN